jgi:hypothetical protein
MSSTNLEDTDVCAKLQDGWVADTNTAPAYGEILGVLATADPAPTNAKHAVVSKDTQTVTYFSDAFYTSPSQAPGDCTVCKKSAGPTTVPDYIKNAPTKCDDLTLPVVPKCAKADVAGSQGSGWMALFRGGKGIRCLCSNYQQAAEGPPCYPPICKDGDTGIDPVYGRYCIPQNATEEEFGPGVKNYIENGPSAMRHARIIYDRHTHEPSLCKNAPTCGDLSVSPDDMDRLSWIIAQGDAEQTTVKAALNVLNTVADNYIAKTATSGSNSQCLAAVTQYQGIWRTETETTCADDDRGCKNYFNDAYGHTEIKNTQGCGWWGRGCIQTTGPCNFGNLQAGLDQSGYKGKFNLCRTPDLICNTTAFPELKWLAGFMYWTKEVQAGDTSDTYKWDFDTALAKAGTDDTPANFVSFVQSTAGLVNRGCACPCKNAADGTTTTSSEAACPTDASASFVVNPACDPKNNPTPDPECTTFTKWPSASTNYPSLEQLPRAPKHFPFGDGECKCNSGDLAKADGAERIYNAFRIRAMFQKYKEGDPKFEDEFNDVVLTPLFGSPEQVYTYQGYKAALAVARGKLGFSAGQTPGNAQDVWNQSAFLANCMKETLKYSACDENNWTNAAAWDQAKIPCDECNNAVDKESCCEKATLCGWDGETCKQDIYGATGTNQPPSGTPPPEPTGAQWKIYPSISPCGQMGQNYKAYTCGGLASSAAEPTGGAAIHNAVLLETLGATSDQHECSDKDKSILEARSIVGTTNAVWIGAPSPMFSGRNDTTKLFWDSNLPLSALNAPNLARPQ